MGKSSHRGVYAASETSIGIRFHYEGQWRREFIKVKPTPSNLRRAAVFREDIIEAIRNKSFDYVKTFPDSKFGKQIRVQDSQTVKEYLNAWHEAEKEFIATSMWHEYRKTLDGQLIPAFGAILLSELMLTDITSFAANHKASQKTVSNYLSPLRIALNQAVGDGLIPTNPMDGWKLRKKRARKREVIEKALKHINPFSIEEQIAIIHACNKQDAPFFQFCFWTGMSASELIALEWDDIDLDKEVVRVYKGETEHADEPEAPKTEFRVREIQLLKHAKEAVEQQQGFKFDTERVWVNYRHGRVWKDNKEIRDVWRYALRRADVPYRKPYQTRHTYASMMLSAGENPMWVANQMGHSDVNMIYRNYGRWIPPNKHAGKQAEKRFTYK